MEYILSYLSIFAKSALLTRWNSTICVDYDGADQSNQSPIRQTEVSLVWKSLDDKYVISGWKEGSIVTRKINEDDNEKCQVPFKAYTGQKEEKNYINRRN